MRHEDARLDSIYDEVAATVVSLLKEMATLRSERDALRTVYKAAAVYCGDRTVANEHALIDAVGEIRALAVQPLPSAEETL